MMTITHDPYTMLQSFLPMCDDVSTPLFIGHH